MYTYIISTLVSLVLISCIFRNREKNFFGKILLIFLLGFISLLVISLIRMPYLKTETVIEELYLCTSKPMVCKLDSIRFSLDTIKTDTGTVIIKKVYKNDSIPPGVKIHKSYIEQRSNAIFRDSAIHIYSDRGDIFVYARDTVDSAVIHVGMVTRIERYNTHYVGDEWTPAWMLPVKESGDEVYLSLEDINVLNKLDSNLLKSWKIINR